MKQLIKRHLLMFFRDKANVFFSLLAVIIIIMLYVTFLGNTVVDSLVSSFGVSRKLADATAASLTLAGMISMAAVTTCLGALSIYVADKSRAMKDFRTTPFSKSKITISYILSSSIAGLILTFVSLFMCLGFIIAKGGVVPNLQDWGMLLFATVLSVMCGNAMVYLIVCFVNSSNAFASLSTVLGTMIGFIMGIYMPIGILPSGIQWVVRCFPMSHSASMFKQILADPNIDKVFERVPIEAKEEYRELYGVVLYYGEFEASFWFSAAVLAVTTVVCYGLALTRTPHTTTKK
jgi:multidrug/hemolysin transport system permease protein